MTSKTLEVLTQARSLLAAGWCKGWSATTSAGEPVAISNPSAAKFCSMGALRRAVSQLPAPYTYDAFEDAFKALDDAVQVAAPALSLTGFNDSAEDVEEVLDVFDEAIEKVKAALR